MNTVKFIFSEASLSLNSIVGDLSWAFSTDQCITGIQSYNWMFHILTERIYPNMNFLMVTLWLQIEILSSSLFSFMSRNVCLFEGFNIPPLW